MAKKFDKFKVVVLEYSGSRTVKAYKCAQFRLVIGLQPCFDTTHGSCVVCGTVKGEPDPAGGWAAFWTGETGMRRCKHDVCNH